MPLWHLKLNPCRRFEMQKYSTVLCCILFSLVFIRTSLSINPCPIPTYLGKRVLCSPTSICASLRNRRAICIELPSRNSSTPCVCPEIYKPVCCRLELDEILFATWTTVNECECECDKGNVLFPYECSTPPTAIDVLCTREIDPTCCHLDNLDITFTADNPCMCIDARNGTIETRTVCML